MLDLFAELAGRGVAGQNAKLGSDKWRLDVRGQLPPVRAPQRLQAVAAPCPERPPPVGPDWPGGAPEALLTLWTELAWRQATRHGEDTHDPSEHSASAA